MLLAPIIKSNCPGSKTSFKLEFISGVINGVVTTDKDTDMKENIQNWCRQKINFLKFVEIDK